LKLSYSTLLFASVILPLSILAILFDRSAEYKNLILCITSLLFVVWGKAFAAALLFLSVIVDYFLAIATEGSLKRSKQSAAVFMIADLIFNGFLFLLFTHNQLFATDGIFHLRNALIPVGVGFYTLKNFSYVYDVYSERINAERNIFCLFTYSVSYPFLLAGPVIRYGDIEPQLRKRTVDATCINSGLTSFAIGFAKTVLVVPVLTKLYEAGLDREEATLAGAWIGMIAFFGAAYFTFAGLSDMGTGIARMNGFDVEKNYGEISGRYMVGGLLKSYNTSMVTLFEDMRGTGSGAVLMTAVLAILGTAFYAESKFIFAFGAVIAVLLIIEWVIGYENIERIPGIFKAVALFIISMAVFSGFAFESFGEWKSWVGNLIGMGDKYILSTSVKYTVINNCWLLAIAFISVTPIGRLITAALERSGEKSDKAYGRVRVIKTVCTAALLIISFIVLAATIADV
jgi:alginate O-acetyltransferase complex protein AlgI